jgi:hypothetical protein
MAKLKLAMPSLENATPQSLADELGKLAVVRGREKQLTEYYRAALSAMLKRTGEPDGLSADDSLPDQIVAGEQYTLKFATYDDTRLNQTVLRETYPEIFEECKRTKPVQKMLVTKPGDEDADALLKQFMQELDLY